MAIGIFVLAAMVASYVLAGYPLLLFWLSRRRHRPIERRFEPRPVSVLLAVHNGARYLEAKLASLAALDYPAGLMEILVLADGCTDETVVIARRWEERGVRVLDLPRGTKASALNAGLEMATGEILFYTDVRQQLDPDCLRQLVACFADPTVGVVSGELVLRRGTDQRESDIGLYWRYEKWIRKQQSLIHSVPGATGAVYAVRRSLARTMPADTLLDDVRQPLNAYFAGYRILFEESARAYDDPARLDAEFNRKVRTLAGVYQLIGAFPALLRPGHPLWLHFLSHKAGRLLLPYALLSIFGASWFLPAPWAVAALTGQMTFYGLALLDTALPARFALKRLSSPARTFAVLMAAALWAGPRLLAGTGNIWHAEPKRSL